MKLFPQSTCRSTIICNSYNSTLTEAENIQAVEDIHRAVVAEREKITDDTSITSLQLTYKLSNGKVLMREYTLPDTSTRLAQIEQVLNCDEARASRNTPELAVTLEHLTYANIGYEAESGDYLYMELTAEQALEIVARYRSEGRALKEACKLAAADTGFGKNELYQMALNA